MSFPFVSLLNSPLLSELAMLGELCDLGVVPSEEELMHPKAHIMNLPLAAGYIRPWRATAAGESGFSHLQHDKDGFKVNLDVQQFKPEELKVKVVNDFLVVEAKHDERLDRHGWVSRAFTRRYHIPDDVDVDALASKLSSDGVLTLSAPKKAPTESGNIREIPITQTNTPAVKDKKATQEKMEDN